VTADLQALKAIFDQHRHAWIAEHGHGRWAVVTEAGMQGAFDEYEEAFRFAMAKLGQAPYLIQQLLPSDTVESIQHVYWS